MKPMFKTTILAGLLAGVALAAAVPVMAQQSPVPQAQVQDGTGPVGQGPMGPGNANGPMMGNGGPMGNGPMMAGDGPQGGAWPKIDLKQFDANGDGKISLEEIQSGRKAEAAALDANGDGKLSADELVAGEMRQIQARVEARVKARIEALDTDGDGMLSAAELAMPPAPSKMFERLDANNDGVLSEDELAAARPRMQPGMMQQGPGRMGPQGERMGRGGHDCDMRGGHGDRGERGGMMGKQGGPRDGSGPRWMQQQGQDAQGVAPAAPAPQGNCAPKNPGSGHVPGPEA